MAQNIIGKDTKFKQKAENYCKSKNLELYDSDSEEDLIVCGNEDDFIIGYDDSENEYDEFYWQDFKRSFTDEIKHYTGINERFSDIIFAMEYESQVFKVRDFDDFIFELFKNCQGNYSNKLIVTQIGNQEFSGIVNDCKFYASSRSKFKERVADMVEKQLKNNNITEEEFLALSDSECVHNDVVEEIGERISLFDYIDLSKARDGFLVYVDNYDYDYDIVHDIVQEIELDD